MVGEKLEGRLKALREEFLEALDKAKESAVEKARLEVERAAEGYIKDLDARLELLKHAPIDLMAFDDVATGKVEVRYPTDLWVEGSGVLTTARTKTLPEGVYNIVLLAKKVGDLPEKPTT